ncbi:MAG: NAD-dependent epimerase/dehydratase family protein [Myxococcota bacterium]
MPDTRELHVVFGAGQVGPLLARHLAAAGKRVRLVRRSAQTRTIDGVELTRADVADATAAATVASDAAVVYHCINPAVYSTKVWSAELPRVQDNLIHAAARAGARLVVLNNVYALGRTHGRPMSETTPYNPYSKKGEIRAQLQERLDAAVKRGDVRAVTGRASDFYGPGGVGTHFAERFWKPVLAGKPAAMVVNPDTLHSYHYIPDVAAGLAALGTDAEAEGIYMLPCQPAETTRALATRLAAALDHTVTVSRMSPLLLKVLSFAMPIVRELGEMSYQWEESFVVDDAKFRARYGALVTVADEAARTTAEWGRALVTPARMAA